VTRFIHLVLIGWGILTGGLATMVWAGRIENGRLSARMEFLESTNRQTLQYCAQVHRVNDAYEQQFRGVLNQLGLMSVRGPESSELGRGGPGPGESNARGKERR
jgi:hypothetical protein